MDKNEKEKRLVENNRGKRKLEKDIKREKEDIRVKKMQMKDRWENYNMGDFQNLYPLPRGISHEQDALMKVYD